jgi:hypothetical protein
LLKYFFLGKKNGIVLGGGKKSRVRGQGSAEL